MPDTMDTDRTTKQATGRQRGSGALTRTLDKLTPGDRGAIERIDGSQSVTQRLMAMGLLPGAAINVRRRAPLGDPITIEINGYELSVRKSEAACIAISDPGGGGV